MPTTVPIDSVAPAGYKPRKVVALKDVAPDDYKPLAPQAPGILDGLSKGLMSGAIGQGYIAEPSPGLPAPTPGELAFANAQRTGRMTPEAQAYIDAEEAKQPGMAARIAEGAASFVGTLPEFALGAIPGFLAGGPPGAMVGGSAMVGGTQAAQTGGDALDITKGTAIGGATGAIQAATMGVGGKVATAAAGKMATSAATKATATATGRIVGGAVGGGMAPLAHGEMPTVQSFADAAVMSLAFDAVPIAKAAYMKRLKLGEAKGEPVAQAVEAARIEALAYIPEGAPGKQGIQGLGGGDPNIPATAMPWYNEATSQDGVPSYSEGPTIAPVMGGADTRPGAPRPEPQQQPLGGVGGPESRQLPPRVTQTGTMEGAGPYTDVAPRIPVYGEMPQMPGVAMLPGELPPPVDLGGLGGAPERAPLPARNTGTEGAGPVAETGAIDPYAGYKGNRGLPQPAPLKALPAPPRTEYVGQLPDGSPVRDLLPGETPPPTPMDIPPIPDKPKTPRSVTPLKDSPINQPTAPVTPTMPELPMRAGQEPEPPAGPAPVTPEPAPVVPTSQSKAAKTKADAKARTKAREVAPTPARETGYELTEAERNIIERAQSVHPEIATEAIVNAADNLAAMDGTKRTVAHTAEATQYLANGGREQAKAEALKFKDERTAARIDSAFPKAQREQAAQSAPPTPELAPDTVRIMATKEARRARIESKAADRVAIASGDAYATKLPQKTRDAFESAFSGDDPQAMKSMLYPENKTLRAEFERRTGTKLPNTIGGTQKAVQDYYTQRTPPKPDSAGPTPAPVSEGAGVSNSTGTPQERVMAVLGDTPAFIDEIAIAADVTVGEALSAVTMAELKGQAKQHSGKRFAVVKDAPVEVKPAAWKRKTPAKGTPERDAIESARAEMNDLIDRQISIERTRDATKGVKSRAALDKKLSAIKAKISDAHERSKGGYEAHLEDLIESGTDTQRIAAIYKARIGDTTKSWENLRNHVRVKAKELGLPEDPQAVEQAAARLSDFPSGGDKEIEIAHRATAAQRARDEASTAIRDAGEMPHGQADEFRRRLDYLSADDLPQFKADIKEAADKHAKFLKQQESYRKTQEQERIKERDLAFPPQTTYYRQNGFDKATGKALDFAPVTDAKPVAIKGAPEGLEFFTHKTDGKAWAVTESSTGARVGNGNTKAEAIADATTRAEKIGPDKYLKIVQDARKKHGTTPRFNAVSGAKPKPDSAGPTPAPVSEGAGVSLTNARARDDYNSLAPIMERQIGNELTPHKKAQVFSGIIDGPVHPEAQGALANRLREIDPETHAYIAANPKSVRMSAREHFPVPVEIAQAAVESTLPGYEPRVDVPPALTPGKARAQLAKAKVKGERVSAKTGLTPSQTQVLASGLRDAVAKLPSEKDIERFPLNNKMPKSLPNEQFETIEVPGDGKFKVVSKEAASALHKRVTGQPIDGVEPTKHATPAPATKGYTRGGAPDPAKYSASAEEKAFYAAQDAQKVYDPKSTYYVRLDANKDVPRYKPALDAKPVKLEGVDVDAFVHKATDRAWVVSETSTGMRLGSGNTRTEAIKEANARAAKMGAEKYVQAIVSGRAKFGTTPRYDATTKNPKPAPDLSNPESGAVNLAAYAGIAPRMKQIAQKYFTSRGNLPEPVFDLKNRMEGESAGILNEANRVSVDFDRAMRKNGMSKPTPAQRAMLNDVLDGNAPDPSLPRPVVDAVVAMRANIDRLSQRAIDEGLVSPEMAEVFKDRKGEYVKRTYAIDRDPNFIENIPAKLRADYKAYLRTQMEGATDAQLEHHINAMLEDRRTSTAGGDGAWASKDLSALKRRKDVHPTLRALWGEDVDPKVRHVQSVKNLADLISKERMLRDIREAGEGVFLFKEGDPNIDPKASVKIAAEANKTMAPLNGMYTTPEIAEAMTKTFEPRSTGRILEHYMKLNAVAKYSKVVLSPKAQIRQSVGNNMFLVANGHNPFQGETMRGVRAAWKHMRNTGDAESQAYANKLVSLGILDDSATAGEFSAVLRDAKWRDNNMMKVPEKLYQFGDNWQRITLFELEKAQYKKAYPEWTDAQLDAHAAEIVTNQSPTYSRASQAVRDFRRFPLVGPFATFSAEILRTSKNIIKQTKRELASDNPEVRKIGAKRVAGLTVAGGASYVAARSSMAALGISAQEDDDLRKFAAPWMQNGNWVYTELGEDGKARIIDSSYTDPYSYILKIVKAGLRGEDATDAAMDVIKQMLEPFAQEQLLTSALADIARNTRGDSGKPLWRETDTGWQMSEKIAERLGEAFTPGGLTDVRNIIRGMQGKGTESSGRPIDPQLEAVGMFTGQRVQEIDPLYSLQFKAREFTKGMTDASTNFTSLARRPDVQSVDDLKAAREDTEAKRQKVFEDMVEMVAAAQRLGISRGKVIAALRKGGISGENVRRLIANKPGKYRPPDDLATNPVVREAMR